MAHYGGYNQDYPQSPSSPGPNAPLQGGHNVYYQQTPTPGHEAGGHPYTPPYGNSSAHLAGENASGAALAPGQNYGAGASAPSSRAAAHFERNKKGTSKWIKIGIPVLLLVIAAAVVAGVLVSRNKNKNSDNTTSSSSGSNGSNGSSSGANPSAGTPTGSGSSAGDGRFFSGVDAFFNPIYPKDDNPTLFAAPSFSSSGSSTDAAWGKDSFTPASPSVTGVRPDRPRIIAPKYKWDQLDDLITKDPYLKAVDAQIMKNATAYKALPRVKYNYDGDSGILDVSREKKMRIKAYAYAYRRTGSTEWLDAAWKELDHAMGTAADSDWGPECPPPDLWYSTHFLDTAEMTAAFAIAYDWMYDGWSDTQRGRIRDAIVNHGLAFFFDGKSNWWKKDSTTGNWNCVCNGGITMGALAIAGDDTSDIVERVLSETITNAVSTCVMAPTSDGTWRESPNYWYFGTTGHAELTSAMMTATGSDHGLLNTNTNLQKTGLFHVYVTGMTSLFNYADHGPNKFSTTANSMLFYGSAFNQPLYTLFQRDRFDATEPWTMFWYDPAVRGAWWNGLALDHYFNDPSTQWVSMRSSWTDNAGTFLAFKSSGLHKYQTHGDLDCGDFVFDAMGERWFGELGSGDYLAPGYFAAGEPANSTRWTYYRKRTEGQNTIVLGEANQNVDNAQPTVKFESTGEKQGSNPTLTLDPGSTAYVVTDMSTAYDGGATVKRGVRLFNGRKQVLIQDEIDSAGQSILWRAHTNATVDPSGTTATPQGASFTAPKLHTTDQENPGVTVLMIALEAGQHTIQVLFAPEWSDGSKFDAPPSVPLDNWTLDSH
ncbi:chondroitin AC/alginate lyase [Auriculariales sp. MPI-PUGE-AT-0066]|nr:chondroitin AC/alginate lyase [Auriculariales sp. MPI-PUGE-AT-0066]